WVYESKALSAARPRRASASIIPVSGSTVRVGAKSMVVMSSPLHRSSACCAGDNQATEEWSAPPGPEVPPQPFRERQLSRPEGGVLRRADVTQTPAVGVAPRSPLVYSGRTEDRRLSRSTPRATEEIPSGMACAGEEAIL